MYTYSYCIRYYIACSFRKMDTVGDRFATWLPKLRKLSRHLDIHIMKLFPVLILSVFSLNELSFVFNYYVFVKHFTNTVRRCLLYICVFNYLLQLTLFNAHFVFRSAFLCNLT